MIYRSWRYDDIADITQMDAECFAGERWSFSMFASSFEQDGFFGELCEEEDPGLAVLSQNNEKTTALVAYGCVQCAFDSCDLLSIAVSHEYRKQGIGRVMLRRLIGGAKRRGMEQMFLEVRQSNEPAKKLYTSEGFQEVGIRKKYYPDGENAIVMVKDLTTTDL